MNPPTVDISFASVGVLPCFGVFLCISSSQNDFLLVVFVIVLHETVLEISEWKISHWLSERLASLGIMAFS